MFPKKLTQREAPRSCEELKVKYLLLKSCHLSWTRREIFVLLEFDGRKGSIGHHLLVPSKVAVPAKYPHLRRISNICWVAECKPRLLTLSFHHMCSFEFLKGWYLYFCKAIFEKKVGVTLANVLTSNRSNRNRNFQLPVTGVFYDAKYFGKRSGIFLQG